MAKLSGSVGEGGLNTKHDVALVKLMLSVIKTEKGLPYLGERYDGNFGPQVGKAIIAFQSDNSAGKKVIPGVPPDKEGLILPGGETWSKLSAALPVPLQAVRSNAGVSVVYLEQSSPELQASIGRIQGDKSNLKGEFASSLIKVVRDFHAETGLVLSLNGKTGGWRDFDMQVSLVSQGGPGESIHHYGRAVDLGFNGLQWVDSAGNRVKDANLGTLNPTPDKTQRGEFWAVRMKAMQRVAGLFPTSAFGGGDLAHVQDLEDRPLDSAASLVALMQAVGPRKMKWELFEMTPTRYKCDFGLGGEKYMVGRAVDIWCIDPNSQRWRKENKNPFKKFQDDSEPVGFELKKEDLTKALNAKMKADEKFSVDAFLGPTPGKRKKDALRAADITDAEMRKVHELIRGEFEAAADNWNKWKPVLYPGEARRPVHTPAKRR